MQHITRFLLELGAGFAFVGRQVHLEVGGEDFFIDLLFYHLKLRISSWKRFRRTSRGACRAWEEIEREQVHPNPLPIAVTMSCRQPRCSRRWHISRYSKGYLTPLSRHQAVYPRLKDARDT